MKKISLLLSCLSVLSIGVMESGCAPKVGGNDYAMAGVGEVSRTDKGTIVGKRKVNLNAKQPNEPGVGAIVGGLAGSALGYQFGGGRGTVATTALGALAGGVGGHFAEQALTNQEGVEYQVQLDKGEIITLAQGAEPVMSTGQRVLVVHSGKSNSRVVPDVSFR